MGDLSSQNQESPKDSPLNKMGDILNEFTNGLDNAEATKYIIELVTLMKGIRASLKSAPENQESSDRIDEIIMNLKALFDDSRFKRMMDPKVFTDVLELETLYDEVIDALNEFRERCTHAIIIKKMMNEKKY